VPFGLNRRGFLYALARRSFSAGGVLAAALLSRRVAAQSAAERLVAAIQDGGKIIYLRYLPADGAALARELGRALYALRVPLNDIVASPLGQARRTADLAFGAERVRVEADLAADEGAGAWPQALRRLLRTIPGPGMNRVLVGERAPLELAAERRFADAVLPEGAMAVFVPGENPQFLGTMTAERLIASAKARGAL
jgi:hypothetical protein